MSRMIKLNDGCFVAADQIAELKVNSSSQTITVRMKDGTCHSHAPDYRQGVYTALDALVKQINDAQSKQEQPQ
jgi:hypothetical protein